MRRLSRFSSFLKVNQVFLIESIAENCVLNLFMESEFLLDEQGSPVYYHFCVCNQRFTC